MTNNIICFHNPDEENGYLSNWYLSNFVCGGIQFTSAEQYMMYMKAVQFGDDYNMQRILYTTDVAKIKQYGREVRRYNDTIWSARRYGIMVEGLTAKFASNPTLRQKLLSTGNAILCECAVHDRVWGIGLSMKDPNRFDMQKWRGQNLLGKALMEVREILRSGRV